MNVLTLTSTTPDEKGLLSGQYWGELRIFAEVARARSFNRAAERLGLSQPTIGRKVRRLQDLMGAQLFVSSKQGVRLTRRGEELVAALLVFDQSLFSIASDLKAKAKDVEGIVSLSITDGMAAFFAAPAVPAFTARFPNIQLHMKAMGNLNDLRENQTDMMLTFAPSTQPDVICRRLGSLHFLPIATDAYIARHGLPTRDKIANHFILQSHLYQTGAAIWHDWEVLCSEARIAHYCDNSFAYATMVKQRLGIGLLGSYAVREKSAVPLELGVRATLPMYALVLSDRLDTRPVRLVFDWLCDIFSATNPWFQNRLTLSELPEGLPALALMLDP